MSFLQPKDTKFRKKFKGRNPGSATRGNQVAFGEFGLMSVEAGRVSARTIEAVRRVLSRYIRRGGKIWIRIFPDVPITKKPLEVRQGKGKGDIDHWIAKVQPGRILFEIEGLSQEIARDAFRQATAKLPVKAILVDRTRKSD